MARIVAFDYGSKRVGVAVTDPMQIIANGLTTVPSAEIISFVKQYLQKEQVEAFVLGLPKQMNYEDSESMGGVQAFAEQLKSNFPSIPVHMVDERFTSMLAQQTMLEGGLGKKDRQNKALVDQISATIILQSYLENKK